MSLREQDGSPEISMWLLYVAQNTEEERAPETHTGSLLSFHVSTECVMCVRKVPGFRKTTAQEKWRGRKSPEFTHKQEMSVLPLATVEIPHNSWGIVEGTQNSI